MTKGNREEKGEKVEEEGRKRGRKRSAPFHRVLVISRLLWRQSRHLTLPLRDRKTLDAKLKTRPRRLSMDGQPQEVKAQRSRLTPEMRL